MNVSLGEPFRNARLAHPSRQPDDALQEFAGEWFLPSRIAGTGATLIGCGHTAWSHPLVNIHRSTLCHFARRYSSPAQAQVGGRHGA